MSDFQPYSIYSGVFGHFEAGFFWELRHGSRGWSFLRVPGGPMMFTPMTRRTLTTAQQEQERLGHEAVEPAHLLLALLKVGKLWEGVGWMDRMKLCL